jgi:hypothetical protein
MMFHAASGESSEFFLPQHFCGFMILLHMASEEDDG